MPIGRNDPCPCGSGKKYKRCHGALTIETNPNVARANELKSVDMDLTPRLLHFAKSRFGPAWLPDAFAHYTGSQDAEIPEHEWSLAIPWALYLRRVDGAPTLAEEWAAEHGRRATDAQRTVLRAYSNAWLSIWKVTRVERGVGAALTDQLTREERFAYDKSASGMLTLHDALLAIIIDCDGVSFFGGVHPQPLPPQYAQSVLRDARRLCRVRTRAVDPERLHDNDVQLDLVDSWNITVDAMLGAPPPTLTNTDGDLFALTTDDFELTAPRDAVVDRLASMAGASEPDAGEWRHGDRLHQVWEFAAGGLEQHRHRPRHRRRAEPSSRNQLGSPGGRASIVGRKAPHRDGPLPAAPGDEHFGAAGARTRGAKERCGARTAPAGDRGDASRLPREAHARVGR